MYKLKENDVILLIGAGASAEAKVPITSKMIEDLEDLLDENPDWMPFKGLYEYIKKSRRNKDEILDIKRIIEKLNKKVENGNISLEEIENILYKEIVSINIEDLVNTLDELLLLTKKRHPLYPFMQSWVDLLEKFNYEFKIVNDFKNAILRRLRYWIVPNNYFDASYYSELIRFRQEYNVPFRIFSLNYDLCIEETCKNINSKHDKELEERQNFRLERGFGDENFSYGQWDWRRFSDLTGQQDEPEIYLYKLHGSIDWVRDNNKLMWWQPAKINFNEQQIIFGTRQKMQSYDPYLFCMYDFRDYSLKSKIIIVSGYSFGDAHVNDILTQALKSNPNMRILINVYNKIDKPEEFYADKLKLNDTTQIKIEFGGASKFFRDDLKIKNLTAIIPPEENDSDVDLLAD